MNNKASMTGRAALHGCVVLGILAGCATDSPRISNPYPGPSIVDGRKSFVEIIPETTVKLEFAPVPAGRIGTGADSEAVAPFYIGTTEIPWEAYDVLVYGLDEGEAGAARKSGVDATSRPSTPYISIDRGFGHNGFPAISISLKGARAFCAWLSERTGRAYRLPTEAEWELACRLGAVAHDGGGSSGLDSYAWYRSNASGTTHAVASKSPDALGLFDMIGNAAEWCDSGTGRGVVRGGSYLDREDAIGPGARRAWSSTWNASDPQIPKSRWWLADAPFVGFRIVCTDAPE